MTGPNPKTVLVTGGAGFIGCNLVRSLIASGYRVINLDKLTYAGNLASLTDLEDNDQHAFVQGDICDSELLERLFATHCPSAVLNLAAESHVDRSIDGPEQFIQTNIVGTFRLLEVARSYWNNLGEDDQHIFRFLHVSTDEVYGSLGATGYFTETTPYAPRSPYSASKASSDHLVDAYHHTYGLPTLLTNCSNNYGPYQFPEKLIPLMVRNAVERKPLPVYGDGQNIRDWLYVTDHCDAIQCVLEKGKPGECYNIGGDSERTNLQVVHAICDIVDELVPDLAESRLESQPRRSLIQFVTDRPGHDRRYAIDASKIRTELGWQPSLQFEQGLRQTIQWYLDNPAWIDAVAHGNYDGQRLGVRS